MGLYSDHAIVLHSYRFAEADRVVVLLCRSHGKVRAVAKGVRRTKSRFGARLDSFGHVDIQLYEGRGELHTISQAELIAGHANIRRDYDAFVCGQLMCEAIEKISVEQEPQEQFFRLLLAGLAALDGRGVTPEPVPHALRPAFLLKLLGVAGFGPRLRCCVSCGGGEGLSGFSVLAGGILCSACRNPEDITLYPEDVRVLQHLWVTPLADLGDAYTIGIDRLVQRVAEYHLERRLRTLQSRPA